MGIVRRYLGVVLAAFACHPLASCKRSSGEQREPTLSLVVHVSEAYRWVDIAVDAEDGGALWSERVAFPDAGYGVGRVQSKNWQRGPGQYSLRMSFVREDGGNGSLTTPFIMNPDDVRISGYATFFGAHHTTDPTLYLKVVERTPAQLQFEPSSTISREGSARYVVVNRSSRTFFPGLANLELERFENGAWARIGRGMCSGQDLDSLKPGDRLALESSSSACLDAPLAPGKYRYSIAMDTVPRGEACDTWDDPSEVIRTVELRHEVEVTSALGPSAHAHSDVRANELSLGSAMTMGDDFGVTLVAPDGGTACICPGSFVGKERLQAMAAADAFGGMCLTANPDASTVICESLAPHPEAGGIGDYPHDRNRRYPDEP